MLPALTLAQLDGKQGREVAINGTDYECVSANKQIQSAILIKAMVYSQNHTT